MIVICIIDCPISLRGDLSKWLIEINTGVFVGNTSVRVRDELWTRVQENVKAGRATMVYRTQNEQRMAFRVHNSDRLPIDFDGLHLMLKPSNNSPSERMYLKEGFSREARKRDFNKKNSIKSKNHSDIPSSYVVLDLETTGLDVTNDEIIEIGALKIDNGQIVDQFQKLVLTEYAIPENITTLTGITDDMIESDGVPEDDALCGLSEFIGKLPIVAHNASFDMAFINEGMNRNGLPRITNRVFDTLELSRKRWPDVSHKLSALMDFLGHAAKQYHRSLADCEHTLFLFKYICDM